MVNDPYQALRDELNAALSVIEPQINGLDDLTRAGMSVEITQDINSELVGRHRRKTLILGVIAALDAVLVALAALDADGYPNLPTISLIGHLFDELQHEKTALYAAIEIFVAAPPAAKIVATFGEAEPK